MNFECRRVCGTNVAKHGDLAVEKVYFYTPIEPIIHLKDRRKINEVVRD